MFVLVCLHREWGTVHTDTREQQVRKRRTTRTLTGGESKGGDMAMPMRTSKGGDQVHEKVYVYCCDYSLYVVVFVVFFVLVVSVYSFVVSPLPVAGGSVACGGEWGGGRGRADQRRHKKRKRMEQKTSREKKDEMVRINDEMNV